MDEEIFEKYRRVLSASTTKQGRKERRTTEPIAKSKLEVKHLPMALAVKGIGGMLLTQQSISRGALEATDYTMSIALLH